jgi:hypothetical protein
VPLLTLFLGNWQRYLVYGALLAAVAGLLELDGYRRGERKLWEYQAEQARAAVPVVVRQGKVAEKVVTVYRDRIVKVKGDTVTITKEIDRYVPPSADPVLPRGWLLLHDAAAGGAIPEAAGGADVAAPAVAASQAIRDVIGNYRTCRLESS